jgi:hypothetical protein
MTWSTLPLHIAPGVSLVPGLAFGASDLLQAALQNSSAESSHIASLLEPDQWVEAVVDGIRVVEYRGTSIRFPAASLAVNAAGRVRPDQYALSSVAVLREAVPGTLGAAPVNWSTRGGFEAQSRQVIEGVFGAMGADLGFTRVLDQLRYTGNAEATMERAAGGLRVAGGLRESMLRELSPGLADKLSVGFGLAEAGTLFQQGLDLALQQGKQALEGLLEEAGKRILGAAASLCSGLVSAVASSVAGVGAGIGGSIGSIIPGIGNLIGAAIGALVSAIVNAIADFFASLFGVKKDLAAIAAAKVQLSEISRDRFLRRVYVLESKIWDAFVTMFDAVVKMIDTKQRLLKTLTVGAPIQEYRFGDLAPSNVVAQGFETTLRISLLPHYGIASYLVCNPKDIRATQAALPYWATRVLPDARLPGPQYQRTGGHLSLRDWSASGLHSTVAKLVSGLNTAVAHEGFHAGRLENLAYHAEAVTAAHRAGYCSDSRGYGHEHWVWYDKFLPPASWTDDVRKACTEQVASSLGTGPAQSRTKVPAGVVITERNCPFTVAELSSPYKRPNPDNRPAYCAPWVDCLRASRGVPQEVAAQESSALARLWGHRTFVRGRWGVLQQEAARDSVVREALEVCRTAGLLPPDILFEDSESEASPGSLESLFHGKVRRCEKAFDGGEDPNCPAGAIDTRALPQGLEDVQAAVARWLSDAEVKFSVLIEAQQAEVGALASAHYLALLSRERAEAIRREIDAGYEYAAKQNKALNVQSGDVQAERYAALYADCAPRGTCTPELVIRTFPDRWKKACGTSAPKDLNTAALALLSEKTPTACLEVALEHVLRIAEGKSAAAADAQRVVLAFAARTQADGRRIATALGVQTQQQLVRALPTIAESAGATMPAPGLSGWWWVGGAAAAAAIAGAVWWSRRG